MTVYMDWSDNSQTNVTSDPYISRWTDNYTIASLDSNTVAWGNVPGTVFGYLTSTQYDVVPNYCWMYESCDHAGVDTSGAIDSNPTITNISPAHGVAGTTVSVTISGTGLSGATVQAGSGITVTISSTSDTTIQAQFAIANNASDGNRQVTATSNSAISNGRNFDVQVPSSLSVVSDSGSQQTINCGGVYNGVRRDILYRVFDASGQPILTSGMSLTESFQAGTNSCSGVPNTPTPTVNAQSDSQGQFPGADTLALCSPSCLPADVNGNPTGSCTLTTTQTWTANGFTVRRNQLAYHCNSVQVTPQ